MPVTGTWILRGMLVCAMVALTAASACGSVRSAWRPARPGPAVTPGRTVTPAKTPAPGGSAAALAFPSPLAGWAAVTVPPGADGVPPATAELLATTDGGRSWRAQWSGPGVTGPLVAVDRSHAFLAVLNRQGCAPGVPGCATTLLATINGRTWAAVWHTAGVVSSVSLGSPLTGLAAVTPWPCPGAGGLPPGKCLSMLLQTSDGGRHWSPVLHTSGPLDAVAGTGHRWWAVQSQPGVVAGNGRPGPAIPGLWVWAGTGNGRSWRRQAQVARFSGLGLDTKAALVATPSGELWLSLVDIDSCAMHGCGTAGLWRSPDNGMTWAENTPRSHQRFHQSAGCGLASVTVAGDPTGTIYASSGQPTATCLPPGATLAQWTPGGWQPRSVWAERSAIAMSWPSPTVGYASFDGTVARTSDSGQHWTRAWPA